MQITHEEARRLIQFNLEHALKVDQKHLLQSHLLDCMDCRNYADSLGRMEAMLTPILRRKWNQRYIPLPIDAVIAKTKRNSNPALLATRIAAVGVMVIAFMFSVWQLTGSTGQLPGTLPVSTLPAVPTPSTPLTSTDIGSELCTETLYRVRNNDTLGSIADKFSVSKEAIMALNRMKTETVLTGTELLIQTCTSHLTGTANAATRTFTPMTSPTTSTPSGQPTQ